MPEIRKLYPLVVPNFHRDSGTRFPRYRLYFLPGDKPSFEKSCDHEAIGLQFDLAHNNFGESANREDDQANKR